jgi:serine protease inhibitor
VMFLINAIYFKGSWRVKFDPAETHTASFQPATGAAQSMQLMHRTAKMSYAESATWQAVELPYGDSAFVMTVVLPKSGTDITALAASLTPAAWGSIVAGLHVALVDLSLPKLALTYERRLNDDLIALGMTSAFVAGGADFTQMSSLGLQLNISFVRQKTFVSIDELGTEAAAVTAVGITTVSLPQTYVMRVDHPYIFVLRERLSGTVLFMGKITQMPPAS